MHGGKDPGRKIVEDDETHKARNEREILLHHLTGQLPQVIFPHSERTVDSRGCFNRNKPDGHQMADAE